MTTTRLSCEEIAKTFVKSGLIHRADLEFAFHFGCGTASTLAEAREIWRDVRSRGLAWAERERVQVYG